MCLLLLRNFKLYVFFLYFSDNNFLFLLFTDIFYQPYRFDVARKLKGELEKEMLKMKKKNKHKKN